MTVKELAKKEPEGLIGRAYAFSEKAHRAQQRRTGEPYFNHALKTAETLHAWHLDETTVGAGLLHDTVEDTGVPLETIKKEFGDEVAFLVDGVTKLGHIKYRGAENKAENLRKMILALSQDLRVVFIKLADRLHNMQTLHALPPAKQKRVAMETDEIYAPIAYRFGMHNLSGELEDLAFPYLHPREYRWLLGVSKEQYEERLAYLEKIKPRVQKLLESHDIKPVEIEIRAKRYASLYKKLLRRDMDMGRIYDLVAMRIVRQQCPRVLCGARRDPRSVAPGSAAHQGLHRHAETERVPQPAHYGHRAGGQDDRIPDPDARKCMTRTNTAWRHTGSTTKSGAANDSPANRLAEEVTWVQQLKNWQERFFGKGGDPEELLNAMKIDFFKDRIFAVTPHGDVIDLPAGATPVDFAYHVHSAIGNACAGAKVNGALTPLNHELKSGDVVEILMQKGKKPSEDWLRFVKTGIARDHIRLALRSKDQFARTARTPTKGELEIGVDRRGGLIQDISTMIARQHFTIVNFHTEHPRGGRFQIYRIEIQPIDKPENGKADHQIESHKRSKGSELPAGLTLLPEAAHDILKLFLGIERDRDLPRVRALVDLNGRAEVHTQ